MSNSPRMNKEQLEKILIGIVLIPAVLIVVLKDPSLGGPLMYAHVAAFAGLVMLYSTLKPQNYWTALVAAMILYPASILGLIVEFEFSLQYLNYAFAIVYTIAGVLFFVQSLKKSMNYKSFESLSFLLGIFLSLFPLLSLWLGKDFAEITIIYKFGVAFIIGTLMYNDNLWEQYQAPQKKFLILVLLVFLTNIISIASKQI